MRAFVLLLLLAPLVVAVLAAPTADAYACAFDWERPDQSIACELSRTQRCFDDFVHHGNPWCPA